MRGKMEDFLTDGLGMEEVLQKLEGLFSGNTPDFGQWFSDIVSGNPGEAIKQLGSSILDMAAGEIGSYRQILVTILLLGILSVLFRLFMQNFEQHQIADIAHYFSYLLLLVLLIRTFSECMEIAGQIIENIVVFAKIMMPVYFLAVGTAGGSISALGYYQLVLLAICLVESVLLTVCLPLVNAYMLLVIVNGIWEEEKLQTMIELLKKALKTGLRWMLTALTGLGLLQSMVSPVLDQLKRGTAKKAVSAIPGIGNLAEGTAEILLGSAVLIKNSIGLLAFLLLILLCAVPFLKMFLYGILLKAGAALMGIVADNRMTACTDKTGDGIFLLLQTAWTAAACFLIMIAIVTWTAGQYF